MKLKLTSFTLAAVLVQRRFRPAQDSFFKGKTVRIVVPFAAGGGYDIYSRIIGRHMGKYIPGNPVFVVENITGAGGLIGMNHVYKAAKPDGLTIGTPIGTMFVDQLIGKPGIEFDGRKFEYIGAPAQDTQLLIVHKRTGIKSVEQWLSHPSPVKFGSTGPGSANESIPKIVKEALSLPLQVVSGYKGSSVIRLAFTGGEVDGVANAWESMVSTGRRSLRAATQSFCCKPRVSVTPISPMSHWLSNTPKPKWRTSSSAASSITLARRRGPMSPRRGHRKSASRYCAKPSWTR